MTYSEQYNYLKSMTDAEAQRLAHHARRNMAAAGRELQAMVERHRRGEYNAARDGQAINDVLSQCDVEAIAAYLSMPRYNAPNPPIWSDEQARAARERFEASQRGAAYAR